MLSRSLATQVDGAPHGNASARSAVTDRKEIESEGNGLQRRGRAGAAEESGLRGSGSL